MHDQSIGSVIRPTANDVDKQPEQQLTDDRLTWTVPEAAHLLGISKDTAYEAARRGDLPVRVIGRRMLVPRSALLRLLDEAHTPDGRRPHLDPGTQVV
jgi:excisionase family DNA binding protein